MTTPQFHQQQFYPVYQLSYVRSPDFPEGPRDLNETLFKLVQLNLARQVLRDKLNNVECGPFESEHDR